MKNMNLKYGALIVDCEKTEILMYVGRSQLNDVWVSPKGRIAFNQEDVKSFIPMFDEKIMTKEELLTNRFVLYSELSKESREGYELALKYK